VIDFLISHSWSDDVEGRNLKYEKLEQLANKFYKNNKRCPTFWFDKVCFDQDKQVKG
jgi:hypothetical protein